jgi:hypothetical protein
MKNFDVVEQAQARERARLTMRCQCGEKIDFALILRPGPGQVCAGGICPACGRELVLNVTATAPASRAVDLRAANERLYAKRAALAAETHNRT